MIRFLCSGRLGDFIHQLYSVKRICESLGEQAHLVVGGDEIGEASNFSKPISEAVEDLKDLLACQKYIGKVEAYSGQDLNSFDYCPGKYKESPLLWKTCWTSIHNHFFNLPEEFNYGPWLTADPDLETAGKVLIHRARKTNQMGYPDRCTGIIDWDHLIQNNDCIFIGFETWQYETFIQEISPESVSKLGFVQYDSILEFCRAISGAKFFVGNQSSPLAMAQALDVPRLGELSNGDSVHYVGEENYFPGMKWVSDCHFPWNIEGIEDKINLKLNMIDSQGVTPRIEENQTPREKQTTKPTLCLATVCKNEEECIERLLESVYKFIDYWVIVDTGSTDRTCEIIENFFREKGIPGELHHEEWVSFGHNKTQMMAHAKGKSDYLIHIDADDYMVGDLDKGDLKEGHHAFFFECHRGPTKYKTWIVFDNRITWRFIGVAHTLIKCVEIPNFQTLDLSDKPYYMVSVLSGGARSNDPEKYHKDALNLQKQFFDTLLDDPDDLNMRSVFYAAQSYFDCGKIEDSLRWYRLYTKMTGGWEEEYFESHMRIARCMMELGWDLNSIVDQMSIAINMFPDRAEPLWHLGRHCNNIGEFGLGYKYLSEANKKSLEEVQRKYILFVNSYTYGDFVKDDLSVSCYWTGRYQEGYKHLMDIIDKEEFIEDRKRLEENKSHFQNMMSQ